MVSSVQYTLLVDGAVDTMIVHVVRFYLMEIVEIMVIILSVEYHQSITSYTKIVKY